MEKCPKCGGQMFADSIYVLGVLSWFVYCLQCGFVIELDDKEKE